MRKIAIVTVARSDYGIYLPILRLIQADPDLQMHLIVSGMHLSPEFGLTVEEIARDGYRIDQRVEMLVSSDTPQAIAKSIGLGVIGFAQAFASDRPDLLVVLGDRFEMYAAALAALPFKIPLAHIHGGELTQGAIDDALRHSMTRLSHLHFVATEPYARRVIQMGEEPWRITISGAPSLDNLHQVNLLTAAELIKEYGFELSPAPILVTFHPVTLEYEQTAFYTAELLAVLEKVEHPLIFTLPNADTSGREIIRQINEFLQVHPHARLVANLGTQIYFSLMAQAAAMVGNSSSGIIEAASFELPVVNIGTRQAGRVRARNVIDTGYGRSEITNCLKLALDPNFKQSLKGMENPYGNGEAAEKIVSVLKSCPLDDRLMHKCFYDLPDAGNLMEIDIK